MPDAASTSEQAGNGAANGILKSGPLFISSKGLGWRHWKRRWFVLTNTSLVFFKSDPSVIVEGGGEVNLTLGGIDLNNSGSVIVREDKRLLTILFPDGQDGRAFTLKTETSEDLHAWRTALEHAFTQAPCTDPTIMRAGTFINDVFTGSFYNWKDKHIGKSRIVGNPISLALQEADGSPSLLEKALCFLEEFGAKVEGILRISADVEEVQQRIQEYEQGKTEFDANEDAHVVGDCVKHILRELPSSPVPISCCDELLKAYDQNEAQINAFRVAILKKLPEPNQLLFQRILKMMYTISCCPENRMTPSAVATCMAPLLLRPILSGECNLTDDIEFTDDDYAQFFAAANAARAAQAIITSILEEYHNIFSDTNSIGHSMSAESEKANLNEDLTDAEIVEMKNIRNLDAENILPEGKSEYFKLPFSGELSTSSSYGGSYLNDISDFSPNVNEVSGSYDLPSPESEGIYVECKHPQNNGSKNRKLPDQLQQGKKMPSKQLSTSSLPHVQKPIRPVDKLFSSLKPVFPSLEASSCDGKSPGQPASSSFDRKTSSLQERDSQATRMCSTVSLGSPGLEKLLEMKKNDLQLRLEKEAKVNALLQASLEGRKQALLERRLILHQDVEKLREQLHAGRDPKLAAEVGLSQSLSSGKPSNQDSTTMIELEEIALAEAEMARLKHKVVELRHQLSQQEHLCGFPSDTPDHQQEHLYGFPSDTPDHYQIAQTAKPHQRSLQQEFDATIASSSYESLQKTHGILSGLHRRTAEGTHSASSIRDDTDGEELISSMSYCHSEHRKMSYDGFDTDAFYQSSPPIHAKMSQSVGSSSPAHSASVVELDNHISFLRKRRSQLMKLLRYLDLHSHSPAAPRPFHLSPTQPSPIRSWS
uniref:Rho GTPase activating protein n=1 Tax=Kalanchoe fedtschenkoi TaxID=63787 RepID=A0A7N0RIK1_KALFE